MAENGVPKSLAVLIDADNTSARYAHAIFEESPRNAVKIVARAIEDSDDDGWVNRVVVGSRILGAAPDFDPSIYGCSNLSTLVTKSGGFEVRKEPGKPVLIWRTPTGRKAAGRAPASA